MAAKVILYGIDGGTESALAPLMRAGRLPNLASLSARGCRAALESTVPWHSAPAWSSMSTGALPGKHGVFNFFEMQPDLRNLPLPPGAVRAEKIWHALNRRGLSAGVVNVPVTYPAEPLDGFMISGLPGPGEDVFPPERKQTISEIGRWLDSKSELRDGYFIEPRREVNARIRMDGDRARAALEFAGSQPDFLMYVFSSTDELQHRMWHSWDTSHPANARCDPAWEPQAIPQAYEAADAGLATLLRAFGGPETTVFAVSDHGFGPARWIFFPNRLLAEWGWLSPGGPEASDPLAPDPNYSPSKLGFDPRRTRAFMGPALVGPFAEIFINVKGRNPHGTVAPGAEYESARDELARRFLEWQDPLTGYRPAAKAHKRESIFSGPRMESAPDLLIECAPGCRTMADVSKFPPLIESAPWHVPTKAQTGTHIRDGIFIAAGPVIRAGVSFDKFRITDIMPTILHCYGLPIPENLDGRVLTEIFTQEFMDSHPVRYEAAGKQSNGQARLDAEDAAAMTRRLEGLGYFT
ncbi:MAG: alkaline phosphatase family protein [bacterium]